MSSERTLLSGPYRIINHDLLAAKVLAVDDPRHDFYLALRNNRTYEGYLSAVGSQFVDRPNYKMGPTSGRDEILYWRRNGWIVDGR